MYFKKKLDQIQTIVEFLYIYANYKYKFSCYYTTCWHWVSICVGANSCLYLGSYFLKKVYFENQPSKIELYQANP